MGILRWPYPETPIEGYWGNVTATIDWCEENYVVSKYFAEWSNTLSNTTYLVTAFYACYSVYRNKLEFRFVLTSFGFALVGIGSWLFHMSLQYRYQLLDELPMIYATTVPAWSMVCEFAENKYIGHDTKRFSRKVQVYAALAFSVAVTLVTVIYIIYRNPLIHEFAYAFFTGIVVLVAGWLNYRFVRDSSAKRNLTHCMGLGIVLFAVGFIAWQIDNNFCSYLIRFRRSILKLPFGVFFELHGWWHVLTGFGVYYYIVFLEYLRVLTQNKASEYIFIWRWGIIPELVRADASIKTKFSYKFLGRCVEEQF